MSVVGVAVPSRTHPPVWSAGDEFHRMHSMATMNSLACAVLPPDAPVAVGEVSSRPDVAERSLGDAANAPRTRSRCSIASSSALEHVTVLSDAPEHFLE